jgi:hypothetical protein
MTTQLVMTTLPSFRNRRVPRRPAGAALLHRGQPARAGGTHGDGGDHRHRHRQEAVSHMACPLLLNLEPFSPWQVLGNSVVIAGNYVVISLRSLKT